HTHGGLTSEGRLTLMEMIRRLRYFGYLEQIGITERDPGEVFEKLIDHLAATHDWSGVSTGSGSDRAKAATKKAKKVAKKTSKKSTKASKSKTTLPEPEEIISEPVKLHYVIDRRDFLEKVKSVYASYAG